jgi:two-component system, NtrC family, sensor kinase
MPFSKNILIVDDSPINLKLLESILSAADYHVTSAADGEAALRAVRNELPSLVVLDVKMESMNGFEICRRLKADVKTNPVPVIFTSASEHDEDKIQGFRVGGVDFISKPFHSEEVLARVETHLSLRKMQLSLEEENAKLTANEEVLRQSEERFRSIYELSPIGIANIAADGRILRCNKALEHFWGYTERELKGMTFTDLTHREDASIGPDAMKQLTEAKTDSFIIEKRYTRKGGRIVWGRVTVSAIRDSMNRFLHTISIVEDITERKNAEQKQQHSELQLRMVWEKSADSMRLTNERGIMLMVNEAFCRMVGMDRDDLEGKSLNIIYAQTAREHVLQSHNQRFISRTISPVLERELVLWNGNKRWLEVTNSFIDFNEDPMLLGIFRDVTDRKRIENELAENRERLLNKTKQLESTIRDLQQMQESLVQSEKMASIGQLTAGIAHEINNPLAFVASNLNRFSEYFEEMQASERAWRQIGLDLSARLQLPAAEVSSLKPNNESDLEFIGTDFQHLMGHTLGGVERIKKIVEQLRGFSHVSGGELAEEDINAALDNTLVITWNELKYNVEIVKEYGSIPPLLCNIGELKQVFVNLLVNAAHAIKEKGTVTLSTSEEKDNIVIRITDTGCGIASENLTRIFDPFFTTKPVGKGTGLGLWISATLIQRHQGTIAVKSSPGEGTTFTITLPRTIREMEQSGR